MKRYLVFSSCYYYPCGGWGDFVSTHDPFEEAVRAAEHRVDGHNNIRWAEVVDTQSLTTAWRSDP